MDLTNEAAVNEASTEIRHASTFAEQFSKNNSLFLNELELFYS